MMYCLKILYYIVTYNFFKTKPQCGLILYENKLTSNNLFALYQLYFVSTAYSNVVSKYC